MGLFHNPRPPEQHFLDSVLVGGYRYHCPDIERLDLHLTGLVVKLRLARLHGSTGGTLRALGDIDALLDRRLYLMLTR